MKDRCYILMFDKKDKSILYDYAARIRRTHEQKLVDDLNEVSEQIWNDHRGDTFGGVEPIQVAKAADLVVNVGITHMVAQFQGFLVGTPPAAPLPWRYMAYGRGTVGPVPTDTALELEVTSGPPDPRVDMTLEGWIEYTSTSLRFGAVFGENRITTNITQAGVFTALTPTSPGNVMLNRNLFGHADIRHVQNNSVFVISSIIEFVPIV